MHQHNYNYRVPFLHIIPPFPHVWCDTCSHTNSFKTYIISIHFHILRHRIKMENKNQFYSITTCKGQIRRTIQPVYLTKKESCFGENTRPLILPIYLGSDIFSYRIAPLCNSPVEGGFITSEDDPQRIDNIAT